GRGSADSGRPVRSTHDRARRSAWSASAYADADVSSVSYRLTWAPPPTPGGSPSTGCHDRPAPLHRNTAMAVAVPPGPESPPRAQRLSPGPFGLSKLKTPARNGTSVVVARGARRAVRAVSARAGGRCRPG